jgi:hypothetical protein
VSRELIGVEYRCDVSRCACNFGDPDAARDFDVWGAQIRIHQQNFHNIQIAPNAYLNDLLRPVYSVAHGDRSASTPADRTRSCS